MCSCIRDTMTSLRVYVYVIHQITVFSGFVVFPLTITLVRFQGSWFCPLPSHWYGFRVRGFAPYHHIDTVSGFLVLPLTITLVRFQGSWFRPLPSHWYGFRVRGFAPYHHIGTVSGFVVLPLTITLVRFRGSWFCPLPSHWYGLLNFSAVKILTVCGFPSIFHEFFIIFSVYPWSSVFETRLTLCQYCYWSFAISHWYLSQQIISLIFASSQCPSLSAPLLVSLSQCPSLSAPLSVPLSQCPSLSAPLSVPLSQCPVELPNVMQFELRHYRT